MNTNNQAPGLRAALDDARGRVMPNSKQGISARNQPWIETPISPGFFQAIVAEKRSSPIWRMKVSGIPRTLTTFKRAPPSDLSSRAHAIDFSKSSLIRASPYAGLRVSLLLSCMTSLPFIFSQARLSASYCSTVKLFRLSGARRRTALAETEKPETGEAGQFLDGIEHNGIPEVSHG